MTWQPIETAPKDGTAIIGWVFGWPPTPMRYFETGAGWNEDKPGWYCAFEDVWLTPTHWTPLPAPPAP